MKNEEIILKAVILAAGVGSRLGMPFPKSLKVLPNGETIIGRQIRILREKGIEEIIIVVGFKMNLIMENNPDVYFAYNPFYYVTNTAKSLMSAIKHINDDVIWMNGDIVFDEEIISNVIRHNENVICVNTEECGKEEIKYTIDKTGFIKEISKTIKSGLGEAMGINTIKAADIRVFKKCLDDAENDDYFEKAIELSIAKGIKYIPLDISNYKCIEIDFNEDWERTIRMFS